MFYFMINIYDFKNFYIDFHLLFELNAKHHFTGQIIGICFISKHQCTFFSINLKFAQISIKE